MNDNRLQYLQNVLKRNAKNRAALYSENATGMSDFNMMNESNDVIQKMQFTEAALKNESYVKNVADADSQSDNN
ncbi:MAG: hypothetical protein ABI723_07495 [Bacteroidia bacterium]